MKQIVLFNDCRRTVSYTHLDVYKRQMVDLLIVDTWRKMEKLIDVWNEETVKSEVKINISKTKVIIITN